MARPALFESVGRRVGKRRRMLAFGVVALSSGPRPSFDDGWDLTMCLGLENGHLRYLRDLRALCDGSSVMPSCLCVFVFAMSVRGSVSSLCLCGSTRVGWVENPKSEIRNPNSPLLGGNLQSSLQHPVPWVSALAD